jgi:ubiquinone/menaquinone biosynthesis C-methylase UbiE
MTSHTSKVEGQFGGVADAYLSSTVHSQGDDLAAVAGKFIDESGATVLDVGCGAGHLSFAIAPRVTSMIAYDLSLEMLEVVRHEAERRNIRNIVTKQGRIEQLPFRDSSFEWVCTRYSAHHWSSVLQGIAEIHRVLQPGGTFILIDTCAPASPLLDTHLQAIELLRDGSHVRNYTDRQWDAMLRAQGLELASHAVWKITIDFKSWVERMRTPQLHVAALLSLLKNAPQEVRDYYQISEDGSFHQDCILIEAKRRRTAQDKGPA